MKTFLLLAIFFFAIGSIALLYGQIAIFTILFILFVASITTQIPHIIQSKPKKQKPTIAKETFVINSDPRKKNPFNKMGLYFMSLPILESLFTYEKNQIIKKIPATGQIIDEIYFVMKTSILTVTSLILLSILLCVTAIITNIPYLLILIPIPLLFPIIAPITLDFQANSRGHKTSAEILAFLTYSSIVHTVNKTMFWTLSSISTSNMFDSLQNDARIVQRYAHSGGEEEGLAITKMAKHHPNDHFKTFLQKYVSYIGTNTTRLGNYVEQTRDAALEATVQKIKAYTGTANTIFFMGAMMVSILPIMFTVMAFLPNSNLDPALLIHIMFVVPFVFVLFPVALSTGTIFLQTSKKLSKTAILVGAASFGVLYIILPDNLPLTANISLVLFAGINWIHTAKHDNTGKSIDNEIPDMLDYIAEQKKSKSNMIDIFRDYSQISHVSEGMKVILRGIISEITVYSAYDAFYKNRKFPNKTVQFVFFILHAIYQHGGGTYETLIDMAHSIRGIVDIKTQFVSSIRFSVFIMVLSPLIFAFSVMMTSFMTFGIPDSEIKGVAHSAMMIKASDVDSVVESLKPVTLIVAFTGGMGLSRIVHYTFLHTLYLFLAGIVSLICILFWDVIFTFMQSFAVI